MNIFQTIRRMIALRGKALMIYSSDRKYYYIAGTGKPPRYWFSVDVIAGEVPEEKRHASLDGWLQIKTDDGRTYHRRVLPFAFYDLKSGARVSIPKRDDFYLDYAANQ